MPKKFDKALGKPELQISMEIRYLFTFEVLCILNISILGFSSLSYMNYFLKSCLFIVVLTNPLLWKKFDNINLSVVSLQIKRNKM